MDWRLHHATTWHCFDSIIIIMLVTRKLSNVMTNVWLTSPLKTLRCAHRAHTVTNARRLQAFSFTDHFFFFFVFLLNHTLFALRMFGFGIRRHIYYLRTPLVAYVRLWSGSLNIKEYLRFAAFTLNGNVLKIKIIDVFHRHRRYFLFSRYQCLESGIHDLSQKTKEKEK